MKALGLALLLSLAPATAGGAADAQKYLEIVRETPDCAEGACFTEYIFLQGGLSIRKQFYSKNYEKPPLMLTGMADAEAVDRLFAEAAALFSGGGDIGNSARESNNIYFYDGAKLSTYATRTPSPAFSKLFEAAAGAFGKAKVTEEFYVHAYYEAVKGGTEDFHVFSDGAFIFSVFGPDYRMASTQTAKAADADMAKLRGLMKEALRIPGAKYSKCRPETGLNFGFVEVQSSGAHLHAYTCGDEGDAIAALLNFLRGWKPG